MNNHEAQTSLQRGVEENQIEDLFNSIISYFISFIRSYSIFNMVFLGLCGVEVFLFLIFFNLLSKSSLVAITLATILVTSFTYFILRIYFQEKKPYKLTKLTAQFTHNVKESINYQEGVFEHHLALAHSLCKLTTQLYDVEYSFYSPPEFLQALTPTLEKFSCWWHFKDVHAFREGLLLQAVSEHLKLIQIEPTNLQLHASLANVYVMLSGLYSDPSKNESEYEEHWIHPYRFSDEMHEKFLQTASKAIEEFKILNDFAPEDPWVHAQLAYSYRDLQMPEEEIREYEILLELNPDNEETLFKLGELYFTQGKNSKGLNFYQRLKERNPHLAKSLIKNYGYHEIVSD